jgi:DNA-binding NarL/FixJ family response regulator
LPGILRPREWEVLELLRRGHSNPEIAAPLVISYDGARHHVAQVVSKLGGGTRQEAGVWQRRRLPALAFPGALAANPRWEAV